MKIFISWSGPKSRRVAEVLREWLPNIFANSVEPWISSRDIRPGQRGIQVIAEELKEARFGIVCLTKGNTEAPWIHFEAGAISKTIEHAYVCTYLIDLEVSDLDGNNPLAPFQAMKADKQGTWRIVASINGLVSAHEGERLRQVFDKWWPDFEHGITDLPPEEGIANPQRQEREILEELVSLTRNYGAIAVDLLARFEGLTGAIDKMCFQNSWDLYAGPGLYEGPGRSSVPLAEAANLKSAGGLPERQPGERLARAFKRTQAQPGGRLARAFKRAQAHKPEGEN